MKNIIKFIILSLFRYEMECYNTIRRASQSLRDLSHKRDTLLEPRSGSLSLPRNGSSGRSRRACYSAPNTLQRYFAINFI